MKIFLSWSGLTSKSIATILRDWIKNVLQLTEPWMSEEDIAKGTRWSQEIANQLSECRVGVICLTPSNLTSPWLLYEAGAISKAVDRSYVCTYLYNIEPTGVTGPLAQFQATRTTKDDTKKMIKTINNALGEDALSESRIEEIFNKWWPDLDEFLKNLKPEEEILDVSEERTDRDLLEEVVDRIRKVDGSVSILASEARKQSVFTVPAYYPGSSTGSVPAFTEGIKIAESGNIPDHVIRTFDQPIQSISFDQPIQSISFDQPIHSISDEKSPNDAEHINNKNDQNGDEENHLKQEV